MLVRIAWRNLWRHRRRTAITVMSIALGIALCTLLTGITDGMFGQMIAMAVRLGSGHLVVEHPAYRDDPVLDHTFRASAELLALLDRQSEVVGYSMRVSGPAMLSSPYGTVGGGFDAVDPELDAGVSQLAQRITAGRYLQSAGEIIVGSEVVRKLATRLGGKVVLTTQNRRGETVQERFRVVGAFTTRTAMLDGFYFQIPLDQAQAMLGLAPGELTQLGIYLSTDRKMDQLIRVTERAGVLAPLEATLVPWQRVLKSLAEYIKVENTFSYVFQAVLVLVIMAGVMNTVWMSVLERTYEFGVLLALGMRRMKLMAMVVIECALLGVLGTGLGALVGAAVNETLRRAPIDLSGKLSATTVGGFFLEPSLTTNITAFHFVSILTAVFVLILVVGIIPAWKAGQVEPVEALHTL